MIDPRWMNLFQASSKTWFGDSPCQVTAQSQSWTENDGSDKQALRCTCLCGRRQGESFLFDRASSEKVSAI